ncbi:MAG: hypothetical protein ABIA11_02635 [Patescibacteria group bacterium]|nr:hypothetical protein [Patescibacteria group bacterium]
MTLFSRVFGDAYDDRWWMYIILICSLIAAPATTYALSNYGLLGWPSNETPEENFYVLLFFLGSWLGLVVSFIRPIWMFLVNTKWVRCYAKEAKEEDISYQSGVLIRSAKRGAKLSSPAKFLLRAVQKYAGESLLFDRRLRKANSLAFDACKVEGFEGGIEIFPIPYSGAVKSLRLMVIIPGLDGSEKFDRKIS